MKQIAALLAPILIQFKKTDESGISAILSNSATLFVVFIRGKILFITTHAEISNLEWSRSEGIKWIEAIFAANANIAKPLTQEKKSPRGGSD